MQVFKKVVPLEIVWNFIKENSEERETCYFLSKTEYKKACMFNHIPPLIVSLKEYYHLSKLHYLEKKFITYANFLTIIRQLCNLHKISYERKMLYDKSAYEVVYLIEKKEQHVNGCEQALANV